MNKIEKKPTSLIKEKKADAINCHPKIEKFNDEEHSVIKLSHGLEQIFCQMLLSGNSKISLNKRMELIESLCDRTELNNMIPTTAKAYIKSLEEVRRVYYQLKELG